MNVRLNKKTKTDLIDSSGNLGTLKTKNTIVKENITTVLDEPFLKPENIRKDIVICGIKGTYADTKTVSLLKYSSDDMYGTLTSDEYRPTLSLNNYTISLSNSPFTADTKTLTEDPGYWIGELVNVSDSSDIITGNSSKQIDTSKTYRVIWDFNYDYECKDAYIYFYNLPSDVNNFSVYRDNSTLSKTVTTFNSIDAIRVIGTTQTNNSAVYSIRDSQGYHNVKIEKHPGLSYFNMGDSADATITLELYNCPGSTLKLQVNDKNGLMVSQTTYEADADGNISVEWLLSQLGYTTGAYTVQYVLSNPKYITYYSPQEPGELLG